MHFILVAHLICAGAQGGELFALQASQWWHTASLGTLALPPYCATERAGASTLEEAVSLLSRMVTVAEVEDLPAADEVKISFVGWLRFLLATAKVRQQQGNSDFMLSPDFLKEFQKHPEKLCAMLGVLSGSEIEILAQGMNKCYMPRSTGSTPNYSCRSRWWQHYLDCRAIGYCVALLAHWSGLPILDAARAYETMVKRCTSKQKTVMYRNFRQRYVDEDRRLERVAKEGNWWNQALGDRWPTGQDLDKAMILSGEGKQGANLSQDVKHELWSLFAGNCASLTVEAADEINKVQSLLIDNALRLKSVATSKSRKKIERQKDESSISQGQKRMAWRASTEASAKRRRQ
ncbi:hypothetical protein DUNSADRAFT_10426 [Dunaliella salina]|uniref:Uncharacterized protein n=1 Tax=Dunaliella salina TaxID=3046 RepID=A0ABQ7GFB7_DUNSA|nr:hypothetical protein DUNSADRAFT_10426 [Dunaliella salina]|eukprot:KAF5833305.1 hypothetical protein DUNSADRAFT_10426 [Dunaliella salina]